MNAKNLILTLLIMLILLQIIPMMALKQNSSNYLTTVGYNDLFQETFNLTEEELALLEQNEFVVLNRMGTDDVLDAYRYYWKADLPIMITTDTLLHTWHLLFDETLVETETTQLAPLLNNLTHAMVDTVTSNFPEPTPVVNDVVIYLAVAEKLVNNFAIPPIHTTDAVNQIVTAIEDEIPIYDAKSQFSNNQIARFIDDFSQYKPRGHYTRSEDLMRYFRLFKWLSRIPFFFDHYCSESILQRTPEEMVQSAILLLWALKNTKIQVGKTFQSGITIWDVISAFLDGLIGKTYTISPLSLDQVCREVTGTEDWNPSSIMGDTKVVHSIQDFILTNDSIPEPKDLFIVDGLVIGCKSSPKMFSLFGERLTIDSYVLNHLVDPYVPNRLLPNTLDVAATCLNSDRALQLVEGGGYLDQLLNLREDINAWDAQEKQTVSWEWIENMAQLTMNEPELNDSGQKNIPKFMRNDPWMDEKLTTVLGSYAQLRHDTILYAKQSITGIICSTPEGYVEPYPEFYKSLGTMCKAYKETIEAFDDLKNSNEIDYKLYSLLYGMELFINATEMLEGIAYHELKGQPLTEAEKEFIRTTYSENGICGGPFINGWLGRIISFIAGIHRVDLFPNLRTSLIADIHTDLNTGNVLEIATGVMEHLIAIVPGWNETEILVAGPVFSFYEFITPITYRMTDEDWRGILAERFKGNDEYDYSVFARGYWSQSYMVSTEMTTDIIYRFEEQEELTPPEWIQANLKEEIIDPYSSYTLVPYITNHTTSKYYSTPETITNESFYTSDITSTTRTTNFLPPFILLLAWVIFIGYSKKSRKS